jgi:GNAT superfamily N-acetyltransferase
MRNELLPEINHWELLELLAGAQGVPAVREDGFRWTDSPRPVWGRLCFGLDLPQAEKARDSAIEQLIERTRALACVATTGPASRPAGLESILGGAGFVLSKEATGMTLDPGSFVPAANPPGLSMGEARTEEDFGLWSGIVCRNLFEKREEADAAAFAEIGKIFKDTGRLGLFLGREEGRAVSASASFAGSQGIGGVYFVATEPRARRKGYGAALSSAAAARCFEEGSRAVILQATVPGRPVYESLGFEAVSTLRRYSPPPARSA